MELLQEIIARYTGRPTELLVALQAIQDRLGYIPEASMRSLADALGVPEGDVRAVVSFYTELRTTPPGRHRVRVCNGDSCAATGSRLIERAVECKLGAVAGSTTAGGQVTYDTVYCLGNCALSPSVAIDGEVYGRVTPDSMSRKLEDLVDA